MYTLHLNLKVMFRDAEALAKEGGSGSDVEVAESDEGSEESSGESSGSGSDFEDDMDAARKQSHSQAGPKEPADAPFNVMLTCYTLFERDSTEQKYDRKFLRSWKWSHLILDEAHAVKNSNAMRTVRLNKSALLLMIKALMPPCIASFF